MKETKQSSSNNKPIQKQSDFDDPELESGDKKDAFGPFLDRLQKDPTNAILKGSQFQTVQRQNLARQIGKAYGNKFLKRALITPFVAGTVQRVPGGTTLDIPNPESTSHEITGRYEVINPDGNNRITIHINQAGYYFRGWWQQRSLGSSSVQTISQQRLDGHLTAHSPRATSFSYDRYQEEGDRNFEGTLVAHRRGGGLILSLTEQGWNKEFRQVSNEPTLSDSAIEIGSDRNRDLIRARERTPLDSQEEGALDGFCIQVGELISEYLDTSRSNIARDVIARRIDQYFVEQLRPFVTEQVENEQMPLVRRRIIHNLSGSMRHSGNVSRPDWDWLQIIVLAHPTRTQHLQRWLRISPTGQSAALDAPQNKYRWRFSVVGLTGDAVVVGLGGFLGRFKIEKMEPDTWSEDYFTVLGQVSAGLSAGVLVGTETEWVEFETPFPWTSGNFEGAYTIAAASAGGAPGIGRAEGPGRIVFWGDGTFPSLTTETGDFDTIIGIQLGVEISETVGYMSGGREQAIRMAPRPRSHETDERTYGSGESVHFEINDPSLTEGGRQAIREMVAEHRAALVRPRSRLQIHGYASTTGSDERNQTLSELRARNVLQAIRDILGPAFAIPVSSIVIQGHGERVARNLFGESDNTENVAWRRVQIHLNGRTIITLR